MIHSALSIITLCLALVGGGLLSLSAWVRLSPSDPAQWHLELPALLTQTPGDGRFLVLPEGGDIAAPHVAMTPEAVLAAFDAVALATPRTRRLAGSPEEGRVTYITRSAVFGFPDYTSVAAVPDGPGARLIVFARLRFGGSDMGVNRARVLNWLQQMPKNAAVRPAA